MVSRPTARRLSKKLCKRLQRRTSFSSHKPCLIALEACGRAHVWGPKTRGARTHGEAHGPATRETLRQRPPRTMPSLPSLPTRSRTRSRVPARRDARRSDGRQSRRTSSESPHGQNRGLHGKFGHERPGRTGGERIERVEPSHPSLPVSTLHRPWALFPVYQDPARVRAWLQSNP